MNKINRIHRYDNGLVLLGEEMPWSESVSFCFLLPTGSIYDPSGQEGLASLTGEMIIRGAGNRDNRTFLTALENLGIESSEAVYKSSSRMSAAMPADKLDSALELYADMILRPQLLEEELESAKQVLFQELYAIEDEPSQKMLRELSRIFFPFPWNRSSLGTEEGLAAIQRDDVLACHETYYSPNGAILSVAGRFDWDALCRKIEKLFSRWPPQNRVKRVIQRGDTLQSHLASEGTQTHIGLAWPSISCRHPHYLLAASAVSILSDGMSSRLFSEVREKRGLCYAVSASCHDYHDTGAISCYCGTTAERAQESLDVILQVLDELNHSGIEPPELDRMKIRNKSSLIMLQESTSSRARSIAFDWFFLEKVESIEEKEAEVNALTCEQVNEYITNHPAKSFRLVTLGASPLEIHDSLLG